MKERNSILIVGVGSIGERHLRCFGATGRAELSICELNANLRKTVADRYEITQAFENLEDALSSRPSAVVICTPAHLHIAMATAAAKVGANLLIEKPLSTSLNGIAELREEINRRTLIASVAYVYRAHPVLTKMREALLSGRFGPPLQIVATCGQNFPFFRPAYRETYYKDRATGGGAVQDAFTHVINAGEWLVGPVDSLVADIGHQKLAGVEVEDTVHVLTRHGSVMGCFSLNQHQSPNEVVITVICQHGTVRFENQHNRWRWMAEPDSPWHDEVGDQLDRDTLFIRQAEGFLDSLDGIKAPLCSLEEAIQTLAVNLAILDSADSRQWQLINQQTEPHGT